MRIVAPDVAYSTPSTMILPKPVIRPVVTMLAATGAPEPSIPAVCSPPQPAHTPMTTPSVDAQNRFQWGVMCMHESSGLIIVNVVHAGAHACGACRRARFVFARLMLAE